MNSTIKNIIKKIVITCISILLFYLLGNYARIQTGVHKSYIMFQYPLLCIVSILYGPIVGMITGFVGHSLMDLSHSHFIWYSWASGSGLVGLFMGLCSRFQLFKKEDVNAKTSILKRRIRYAFIVFSANLIAFFIIAPIIHILVFKDTPQMAFSQGFFIGISNGLTSVVVTDLFFSSFKHTILRRIIAILTLLNSLVLVSYGNTNFGSIVLYGLTIIFGLYLFFYKEWHKKSSNKIVNIIKNGIVVAILLFAAEVAFIAGFAYIHRPDGDEQLAIILGAGLNHEKPSKVLQMRLDTAYDWYQEDTNRIIITSGGQGDDEILSEGEAMKNYLMEKGIPEDHIFIENMSTTTEENFRFSMEVLKGIGYESDTHMIFITNNFHCFRALNYAKSEGFANIKSLAAPTPILGLIPNYSRECAALIKYLIKSIP